MEPAQLTSNTARSRLGHQIQIKRGNSGVKQFEIDSKLPPKTAQTTQGVTFGFGTRSAMVMIYKIETPKNKQ